MSMGAYYTAGVGNLSITTDCTGYSYLCQVPQKINAMDNKQNCISLTGMHLTDKSSISPYK
jgi:hypothetical protein